MKYLHHDLGQQPADAAVTVNLTGNAANVQLLDDTNYHRYRRGESFRSIGGHYTHSPAQLTTPRAGHWHVVVDLAGRAGRVGATVSVAA